MAAAKTSVRLDRGVPDKIHVTSSLKRGRT
jgi:hypothetical protein